MENFATGTYSRQKMKVRRTLASELEKKLNWLRAAVLGANDGIVSVSGVLIGVASAGAGQESIVLAGVAAIVAGAVSMAGGEYASVSAQRDTELAHGRTKENSSAHPWAAAWSSLIAFTAGAFLPFLAMVGPWENFQIWVTASSVVVALACTGYWAAWVGGASKLRGVIRNVTVSLITVGASYAVGSLLGATVI